MIFFVGLKNQDSIPDIREFYNLALYQNHSIISSRGCAFNCRFCCNWQIEGREFSERSAGNVLSELKYLAERYNPETIFFAEDNFDMNKKNKIDLCDKIIKDGIKIKWTAQLRVDSADKILLEKIKDAGCERVYLGVESGSQKILYISPLAQAIMGKKIGETTKLKLHNLTRNIKIIKIEAINEKIEDKL
ncbi:MAG: radical SAM protein [Candidatus Pacearchaeota archaeon]